jgi:hypothetical protein
LFVRRALPSHPHQTGSLRTRLRPLFHEERA